MSDATNALAFERVGEPPGIEVIDRIEQQRYAIHTPEPVKPRTASAEDFDFPVTHAVEFETTEITLPTVVGAFVHDESGEIISRIDHEENASFPDGSYTLELSAQIKTYIDIVGAIEIESATSELKIRFEEPTTIRYGARSLHEHPAGTVTTTTDPSDVMAAIETFGSALKTADPERSYPTLRGHPPEIELGDELDIPDGLEPPENGITLELPLDLEHLYVAAPLAFYLGASLEPGPAPQLVTDDGFEYSLDGPEGFQTTVANALKQVFFLDCVTRTEGLYQMPLNERERIEPLVEIDFAELYDRPMAEQVAAYLDVPFGLVENYVPEWPLTTQVEPTIETIVQLPFVVDDLAVVQTARSSPKTTDQPNLEPRADIDHNAVLTRSAGTQETAEDDFVQPEETDAVEQAWIGEDIPVGASKLTVEAFRNRLGRNLTEGDIDIAIVVNDARMATEVDIVDRAYGDRDGLPFDVSVHRNTTVEELRKILGRERGFLHYIGHTERDGFECEDGKLDARNLTDIGIESFLLNACNSYKQGLALIEGGAIGGIVTLADIINQEGVNMGKSVAQLLNAGFPLSASLSIARDESIQGGQYIVIGDGGMSVTQAEGTIPNIMELEKCDSGFKAEITTYATDQAGIGTVYMPHMADSKHYFLSSGKTHEFTISTKELEEVLELEHAPIKANGCLHWSSSIDLNDLF